MYRPDTSDGLFHPGNPLTGEKGTPIPAAFFNACLAILAVVEGLPLPPDNVNDYVLTCQAGVVAWTLGTGGGAGGGGGDLPAAVLGVNAGTSDSEPSFAARIIDGVVEWTTVAYSGDYPATISATLGQSLQAVLTTGTVSWQITATGGTTPATRIQCTTGEIIHAVVNSDGVIQWEITA